MSEKQAAVLENPNVRQFLDFLGKAEGADYNVIVGGKKFDDFSKHPNVVGLRTKEGPSTAAGKYQIVKTTYDDIAPKLGITDFSPQSQDRIAVALLDRRGALDDVVSGKFDSAINKLGKEWASLPSSTYKQPKKDWDFVSKNLPSQTGQIAPKAVATTGEMPVEVVSAQETPVIASSPTPGGPTKLEQLPESYRQALAANYLADTEEDSVADAALAMLEEREEASRGGGGQNTALQALMKRESVDPYQFILAQDTGNTDQGPRRKVVPRMPQRFAEGGDVAAPDLMEQMTVGTLPEDQTPGAVQKVGKDLLRGSQYLPYDLVGMPVDLATMAMRPLGYNVEKPFLGSEYLIDKAVKAGIADQPTGSTAETAARIGMGFVNPAMVGRQAARGIEAVKDVVTAPMDRAKIQAAASKVPEDVAYDPLRNRLESEGILSLAVKPGGGGVDVYNPVMGLKGNAYLTAIEKYNRRTEGNALGTRDPNFIASPEAKQTEDIIDWLDNKATAYFEKQYGSPNDPLFKAFLEGKYSPPALTLGSKRDILFPPDRERIQAARNMLRDPDPEYEQSGRRILSSYYDKATPITTEMGETAVLNRLINPRYRNEIDQYIRDDRQISLDSLSAFEMDSILDNYARTGLISTKTPFTEKDIVTAVTKSAVDGLINKIDIQGGVAGKEVGGMLQRRRLADDPQYPTEQQKAAIRQGEPIYTVPEGAHNDIVERQELTNYMLRTPKEQWERMSFPELVLKAENDYRGITDPIDIYNRIDNYKPVTVEQRLVGTKNYMPTSSDKLGKGAGWKQIVDEGGLLIEGRLLKHCLSEDKKYASFLKNDMSKFFSLRDKDGKAYATIQVDRLGTNGPFTNVHQIKGFKDKSVAKEHEKEIMDFLNAYEKDVGVPLKYTESSDWLPEPVKPLFQDTEIRGWKNGGMVDKPLYDRAV